jgi:hypothetical protein
MGWTLAVEALVIVWLGPFTPADVGVFRTLDRQDGLVVWGWRRRPGAGRVICSLIRFARRQADHPFLKIVFRPEGQKACGLQAGALRAAARGLVP